MGCSLKYGLALVLVCASAAVSDAAQITIFARDLNNQPITGVTLRVRVFDATNRNAPVELQAQQQVFVNTNGTLLVNVNQIVNVQLIVDDNGAGVLEAATLTGLFNVTQQVTIVMPAANQYHPLCCECTPCLSRRGGLFGRFRR